jgi:excisionase family DNA binding protein
MQVEPHPRPRNAKRSSHREVQSSRRRRRDHRHRFLSVPDVATILGTSDGRLYEAIRDNRFPALRVRGRYVVPAKVLNVQELAARSTGSVVESAGSIVDARST